jgi:hypothetical protein
MGEVSVRRSRAILGGEGSDVNVIGRANMAVARIFHGARRACMLPGPNARISIALEASCQAWHATTEASAAPLQERKTMFPKSLLGVTLTLALGVGLALAQESPIQFLKVKEVDQLLKQGRQVTFVDVRSRQEYLIQHIKGALSVPLSAIDDRSGEIPREGLVVLY